MEDINLLRKKKADLVGAARKFDDECTRDGKVMGAEDQVKYDQMVKEIRAQEDSIRRKEELQQMEMASAPDGTAGFRMVPGAVEDRVFATLGDQLIAVARAHRPGGKIDPRLVRATGMGEGVAADGGFLVEKDFLPGLLKGAYEQAPIAQLCFKVPIGPNSNGLKFARIDESSRADGYRSGGVLAYWSGEAATVTAKKPKIGKGSLDLDKLMAICYATDELLEDATALGAIIEREFAAEMSYKLNDAIINGTGSGQPLGILNSDALVSVAKESGQTNYTIMTENILKMWRSLPAAARSRSVWAYNQELEDQLSTLYKVIGVGGSLFPDLFVDGRIKGRPAFPMEQCKGAGSVGDILLIDPQDYLLIDKGGLKAETSIHVMFIYDESTFRFTYRVNGMPLTKSKVTPANRYDSTFYYSPYVATAARTA